MECKSWQLCCLHFHICGQVSCKGWLCPLFLRWWLLGFERHQVLPRHYKFKIHSKFVVVNNMHRTNPKFPNKKHYLNSTKASFIRVSSILTYCSICHRLSWARFFLLCTILEVLLFQGICNKETFKMMMCSSTIPPKILWWYQVMACLLELHMRSTLTFSNRFSLPCRLLEV